MGKPNFQVAATGSRFGFVSQNVPANHPGLEMRGQAPQLHAPAPANEAAQQKAPSVVVQNMPTTEAYTSFPVGGTQGQGASNQLLPGILFDIINNSR